MTRARQSLVSSTVWLAMVVTSCGSAAFGGGAEQTGPFEWRGVARVVAVGDLHGHFDQMVGLLEGAQLVDENLDWIGGADHLILLGDLIDRGPDDRAILDLARKLQRQAETMGGRVHTLLGNHEVMNLTRNHEYVARESFADFSADTADSVISDETSKKSAKETEEERQDGLRAFRQSLSTRGMSGSEFQAAFDERFPPGYFGWSRALATDGEYGSWLIEQPTAIMVNGRVFVHGGLTAEVAALGLVEINRRVRANILAFVEYGSRLEDQAEWPHAYRDLMRAAKRLTKERGPRIRQPMGGVGEAAWLLLEASEGLAFATDGPVWYRGSAIENERIEERRLERVLARLQADGLVVGHTPTQRGLITSRFNRRLHRLDVGMGYGRPGRGLVIGEGEIRAFDAMSGAITLVSAEPPQGQGWPQGEEELPDDVLERFLSSAKIRSSSPTDFGIPVELLELEGEGIRLRAIFGYAQESAEQAAAAGRSVPRRFQNTIAAYRLDRLMKLGRVPVTVPRRVKGKRGLVQIWLQNAWDQELIEEYGVWSSLQGLETEMAEATAFSGLIGIVDRVPAGRMFLPDSRRIVLADNSISFPADDSLDPYLPEGCGPVGPAFVAALRSLERAELRQLFRNLVSPVAIDALLSRRDQLIGLCENPDLGWSIEKIMQRISAPEDVP